MGAKCLFKFVMKLEVRIFKIHEELIVFIVVLAQRFFFNILDLFGTIGGILEIFMFFVELIMEPISEHAFICSAISTFYIIKHQQEEKFFNKEISKKNKKRKSKA